MICSLVASLSIPADVMMRQGPLASASGATPYQASRHLLPDLVLELGRLFIARHTQMRPE
jgi:hypothetical protein